MAHNRFLLTITVFTVIYYLELKIQLSEIRDAGRTDKARSLRGTLGDA